MSNFNSIAPVYDQVVKLVFGSSMRRAQMYYLRDIPPGAHVLILGGGTGWVLAELLSVNPRCNVLYVEASIKMLEITRKKIGQASNNLVFIHGTEESIPDDRTFDLDLFNVDSCAKIINSIRRFCDDKGLWLACDFVRTTWWQGAMIWIMYRFFGMVSDLETRTLPDWKKLIEESGFVEISTRPFYKNFISSALFRLKGKE